MTYTATADQAKGIIEGRIASVIVPMRPLGVRFKNEIGRIRERYG